MSVIELPSNKDELIRVFSDLHLGHPGSRIKHISKLDHLLEGVHTAVFAGDTWQPIFGAVFEESKRALDHLLETCAQKNIRPVILRGNHDPLEEYPMAAYAFGEKVLITHGHALFRESAPWAKTLRKCKSEVDAYWQNLQEQDLTLEERLQCGHDVGKIILPRADKLKTRWGGFQLPRIVPMIDSWLYFPRESARFLELYSPDTRCMISGHFHRAGEWNIRGRRIINTGAFTHAATPRVVDLQNDKIFVRKVKLGYRGFEI